MTQVWRGVFLWPFMRAWRSNACSAGINGQKRSTALSLNCHENLPVHSADWPFFCFAWSQTKGVSKGAFAAILVTSAAPGSTPEVPVPLPAHLQFIVKHAVVDRRCLASYTPGFAELQAEGGNGGPNVGSAAIPPSRLFTPSCAAARVSVNQFSATVNPHPSRTVMHYSTVSPPAV